MRAARVVLAVLAVFVTDHLGSAVYADDHDKATIGAVERVAIPSANITLLARVDTGAASSSLDARDVRIRGPRGARTVRFTLVGGDGRRIVLELPLAGYRSVSTSDSRSERRPVVRLEICVAGQQFEADLTLNDRSHMEHRMLLGRQALAGRFVVDVDRSHAAPPTLMRDALK